MKQYYECHVTFMASVEDDSCRMGPALMGWKFSQIDGDPVLGAGVKSYFTRQFKESIPLDSVRAEVDQVAEVLIVEGYEVLRRKVELVVYDSKQLPDELFA
tara:strand:- start:312 stop:614 length:303 start_codon:yes stop_codon:yes gene_type:complete